MLSSREPEQNYMGRAVRRVPILFFPALEKTTSTYVALHTLTHRLCGFSVTSRCYQRASQAGMIADEKEPRFELLVCGAEMLKVICC